MNSQLHTMCTQLLRHLNSNNSHKHLREWNKEKLNLDALLMLENGLKLMVYGNESNIKNKYMSIYLLSFLLFFAIKAEDKPRIFSYRIQQLKDYDFFNQMQLGMNCFNLRKENGKTMVSFIFYGT